MPLVFSATPRSQQASLFACPQSLSRVLSKVMANLTVSEQSYRNLSLSFRGAERQAPGLLSMALRFSRLMQLREHELTGGTDQRLHVLVEEFNSSPSLNTKHALDSMKEKSVLNLICGTAEALLAAEDAIIGFGF